MNKQEYIETLRHYLVTLPEDERNELLRDYEAHFIYGQQRGKTEQEISTELGDPLTIARETVGSDFLPPPLWAPQRRDIPRLIAVSLLLFFLNIMLAIPIGATIWALFVSFCAVALGCVLAPLTLIIETLLYGDFMISKLFYVIGTTGIGMLLLAAVRKLGTGVYTLTIKYLGWNVETWRGKA